MAISVKTKSSYYNEKGEPKVIDEVALVPEVIPYLDEVKMSSVPFQPYKNFFTYISMKNISVPEQGILSAADVSAVLTEQYSLGYQVVNTVFIGAVEGSFGVFYFLKHKDA